MDDLWVQMSPIMYVIPYYMSITYKVYGYWFLLPLMMTTWELYRGSHNTDIILMDYVLSFWWLVLNGFWVLKTQAWSNICIMACILFGFTCKIARCFGRFQKELHMLDRIVAGSVGTSLLIVHVRNTLSP